MENYQNQSSATQQTEAYGTTDELGNPVVHSGQTTVIPGYGGKLHRSGSGSSSSEDDGEGGRRKKGIMGKIIEKLPGGHKDQNAPHQTTATTTHPVGEKKGIMEKIKDKLPGGGGSHNDQPHKY